MTRALFTYVRHSVCVRHSYGTGSYFEMGGSKYEVATVPLALIKNEV